MRSSPRMESVRTSFELRTVAGAGCGSRGCAALILGLALFWTTLTPNPAHAEDRPHERVAWAGLTFRGHDVDKALNYPLCSRSGVAGQLQNELTRRVREVVNPSCQFLVGQQFEYRAGDALVLTCVIESEQITVADNGGNYFGQVSIVASLLVFDFHQHVVVCSVPLGVFDEIKSETSNGQPRMTSPADQELLQALTGALLGGPGLTTSLAQQFSSRLARIPIRFKGNLGRLRVQPAKFDLATEQALGLVDDPTRQQWRLFFSRRVATHLNEDFGLNILPLDDGDASLYQMTICFADKSQLSASGPADLVLGFQQPTATAQLTIQQAADYVSAKSTSQVVKVFGSVASIRFDDDAGKQQYAKNWSYGVARKFAPQFAESSSPSLKRLYHCSAIDLGFTERFLKSVCKDSKWTRFAANLQQ